MLGQADPASLREFYLLSFAGGLLVVRRHGIVLAILKFVI